MTTRLPIAVSGWSRTVALAWVAVALTFTAVFVVYAFAPESFEDASLNDEESAVVLATGLAFAAFFAWITYLLIRPALVRKAYLKLQDDSLLIVHPGLLKHPLEIPRSAIKAAAIDPRHWRWRWLGNKGRFHLARETAKDPAGAPLPEWLFSVVGGSPFPLLSTVDDVPNVAFVFSEPVRMRSVRRGTRPFATKGPVHVPVHGRDVRGLLVKVKDASTAESALTQWTTLRPLTPDDVFAIQPDPDYARKAKRRRRTANIWLGILLLLLVESPVLSELVERADSSFVGP